MLREEDAFEISRRLNAADPAVADRAVSDAADRAAARGVVGLVDFDMAWNAEAWTRRLARGFDTHRVEFAVYPHDLDRAIAEGLVTGERIADDRARPGADGTAEDHLRRIPRHPHRSLQPRLRRRSAQPRGAHRRARRAAGSAAARDRRRHRDRPACDRGRRGHGRARRLHHDRCARHDRARPAGPAQRPRPVRPAGCRRQRAAAACARRPRHGRRAVGRADRDPVPARLAAPRRSVPALRIRRAGRAARPLAGDRGRGVPHRRRPGTLAPAGADRHRDRPRGERTRRHGRRSGHPSRCGRRSRR